jgi:hypothetical protein
MPSLQGRRRAAVALVAGLGLSGLLAACGDSDGGSSSATTTTAYEQVPMAEALTGLSEMLEAATNANAAAAAADFPSVLEHFEHLHGVWEEVEGTVKATDPDLYEAIETAQSLIKDGGENEDATRVATGVLGQAEAVATFIDENG